MPRLADPRLRWFGITVKSDGREVSLWFPEGDPVRELSGDELRAALKQRIAQQSQEQR